MKQIQPPTRREKYLLVFFGFLFALIFCEVTARFLVPRIWTAEKIQLYTTPTNFKGRFASHPNLPFVLRPNYKPYGHNSLGFRGEEIAAEKPLGTIRVAVLGSSTTYGDDVPSDKAYGAQLGKLLEKNFSKIETVNAGVPGWISTESLINLELRVLPLYPDLIIFYEGRNELFPQSFNNFRFDYSHYRKSDYSFTHTNFLYKKIFSVSRLALFLTMYNSGGGRFDWSSIEENPVYGVIRFENKPSDAEIIKNLAQTERSKPYRETLRSIVALARSRKIPILFSTIAVRETDFRTDALDIEPASYNKNDPEVYVALRKQIEENNEIMREIAKLYDVPVAEVAVLREQPDLFLDDCHFNEKGHLKQAEILYDVIIKNRLLPF